MSKKTLNKLFEEKINKEVIRNKVLNRVNKKSLDYFKIIKIGILVGCLVLVAFLCIDDKKNSNVGNSFMKEEKTEDIDTNELINESQYAFIGLVTEDKDNNDFYKVIVYENIKGELVKSPAIEIRGDNVDLKTTSIYLFTAKLENHDLVILGKENANLLINTDTNYSNDNNYSISLSKRDTETIKEIVDKYSRVNTDAYSESTLSSSSSLGGTTELSKYDVNYKE